MDMKTENRSSTATRPVGLIIRQKDPNNLEMPFDQLDDFITPSELFYIRSHFPTPKLDPLGRRDEVVELIEWHFKIIRVSSTTSSRRPSCFTSAVISRRQSWIPSPIGYRSVALCGTS